MSEKKCKNVSGMLNEKIVAVQTQVVVYEIFPVIIYFKYELSDINFNRFPLQIS